jgi:hypothetical protein
MDGFLHGGWSDRLSAVSCQQKRATMASLGVKADWAITRSTIGESLDANNRSREPDTRRLMVTY